jgi:superfamily II DNA or RNA helicase
MNEAILPGTEVEARGLKWEVVATFPLGNETLFRLRGLENAVLGTELDLLSPFEDIKPVKHALCPDRAAPLANWLVYHQAFLLEQALGPAALLAVQPGRLRIEPYQLVPVLRALRSSRVRLLLADAVGLGKTIQAGLVLTELIARRLAHRVLIVSPAGPLLEQWKTEMLERFGLRLDIIDRAKLDEVRRGTELGSNPFDSIPLGLVSVDFLKQEKTLELLERANYDVVVIDESHHCALGGGSQNLEDTQRRRLAEVLARRCDALLLLTATPHDGYDRSFASLCELLDPSLVDGRGSLRGEKYRNHVVRRLKKHITDPETGECRFKDRVVHPAAVTPDPKKYAPFVALQKSLLELVAPELRRAFRSSRYADVLAYIALLKRSVSTVGALKSTLEVVAARFQQLLTGVAEAQESRRQRVRTLRDYQRKLDRFGVLAAEEEEERSLLEAEELAQQLAALQRETRSASGQQRKMSDVVERLDELVHLAEQARARDPKIDHLQQVIREIRREEPRANVLIYTEYVDSQREVAKALKAAGGIGTIVTMSGLDGEKVRAQVTERFRSQDDLVLVSTDSAAEGLNLHQRCHHLVHFELPFNPNRLEQRNGRIDRYGQNYNPVVKYLYLRGTFEERILLRLVAKYERIRKRLTFVPNTLGITTSTDTTSERLLKGLIEEDARLFQDEAPQFDLLGEDPPAGDEATRELLEEIDRSLKGFEHSARSNAWLGDAGLSAEAALVREAGEAQSRGKRAESVDLFRFVESAVFLDGGERVAAGSGGSIAALRIPPSWTYGLEELPGYDPARRIIRVTNDMNVTADSAGTEVGYLGRAHPLVRRALDRVRNLSFGAGAASGQDPRASAAKAGVTEPALLYTFLGRVSSGQGRELERVIAVRVARGRTPEFIASPSDWTSLADPARAVRTTGLWKAHFEDWAAPAEAEAKSAAASGFRPLAEAFTSERRATLEREKAAQAEWLARRAEEITGAVANETVRQAELFDLGRDNSSSEPDAVSAEWAGLRDPAERLAAFHSDRSQRPGQRSEAEGVLRINKERVEALERLLDLRPAEVIPLGVLMLIPEAGHGV